MNMKKETLASALMLTALFLPTASWAQEKSAEEKAAETQPSAKITVESHVKESSSDSKTLPDVSIQLKLEESRAGESLVVAQGQTVKEVVQIGRSVVVLGTVEGDVVVLGASAEIVGTVKGSVVVFGGNATVSGTVTKDAVVFGGNADVSGNLQSLVTFGGGVHLDPAASIGGDIVSFGGKVSGKDVASVTGKVVEFSLGEWMANKAKGAVWAILLGLWFSPFMLLYRAGLLVVWVAVGILMAALFAPAIDRGAENLRAHWGRNFLVGLLWAVLFTFLVIVFGLLSLILVGLPFLFLLIVFWITVKLFGTVVVFRALGAKAAAWFGSPEASTFYAVFLGACFLGLLRFVPIVGVLAWCVVSLCGAGTTLMSRYGTRGANGRNGEAPAAPSPTTAPAPDTA